MEIKQQIRLRREKLGLSVKELADMVGVSATAVRNWESGRNDPNKTQGDLLEKAMSFSLDRNEGKQVGAAGAAAMVDRADLDLLLMICSLPAGAKALISDMVRMHLDAVNALRDVGAPLPSSSAGHAVEAMRPVQRGKTKQP
jgi:transcriptional regulator with XRE-family HTH domain